MSKKLGLAIILTLFCFNVLADDKDWHEPFKNIISQTEYGLTVNINDGNIYNLHKKIGLRINYRLNNTNFVLTGGSIKPYLQTAIYDRSSKEVIGHTKTKVYYASMRYILWENPQGKIYAGAGLAQERFRWHGGLKYSKYFYEKPTIEKKQIMPFATVSSEIKTSHSTVLSVEVWRYFGRSEFPFRDFSGKSYAFKQDKTQIMLSFIIRFS